MSLGWRGIFGAVGGEVWAVTMVVMCGISSVVLGGVCPVRSSDE